MKSIAVIGKNYGDEGKGHATAYFALKYADKRPVVIRHNGGAQAGHTVETDGKRVVFHQYGSGALFGAPTFLYRTFLPDPVALLRERSALKRLAPQLPALAADARCRVVTVFDVLANQFIEELRGEKRHGSCGMGIWETVLRHRRGCALTLGDIDEKSTEELIADLRRIRDGYFAQRLAEKAEPSVFRGWREGLIFDENLLLNAAEDMREGIKCLRVINSVSLLKENFETFIFEGAQGLLLDGSGDAYAPYTTPSATGSRNIRAFHAELGVTAQETALEVCYVSRSYLTRHGAGPLPRACPKEAINAAMRDLTNEPNEYQGTLRYACHGDAADFMHAVVRDTEGFADKPILSLYLTHLNETGGGLVSDSGLTVGQLQPFFDRIYLSRSRDSRDTEIMI